MRVPAQSARLKQQKLAKLIVKERLTIAVRRPVLHYRPGTYILPPSADLVVIRGLSAPSAAAMTRTVTVSVKNGGQQTIDKISLVEAIATGQQYVWGTMYLNNAAAVVRGTNPYYIDIGSLAAGVSATVTYEIGAG